MEDDKVVIKCKGLDTNLLNEEHFKKLLSGKNISIDTSKNIYKFKDRFR
jgi:hypothetical protein